LTGGYTVVVPDDEGVNMRWVAGQQSGYATLDGIRAAAHYLKVSEQSTPVGMVGYSAGRSRQISAQSFSPSTPRDSTSWASPRVACP
jgi:hypothetical protein